MMKVMTITICTKCGDTVYGSSMKCRNALCNGKTKVIQAPTMCLKCRSEKSEYFSLCKTCGNINPKRVAPTAYLAMSPVRGKGENQFLDESLNIGQELLLEAQ